MAGLPRKQSEDGSCYKTVIRTAGGEGASNSGDRRVYAAVAVLREMAYKLSIVESGEGKDAPTALYGAESYRCWGL